jgi:hypothetical protein
MWVQPGVATLKTPYSVLTNKLIWVNSSHPPSPIDQLGAQTHQLGLALLSLFRLDLGGSAFLRSCRWVYGFLLMVSSWLPAWCLFVLRIYRGWVSTDGPGWSPSPCWNTNWLHRWLELLSTNKERRVIMGIQ